MSRWKLLRIWRPGSGVGERVFSEATQHTPIRPQLASGILVNNIGRFFVVLDKAERVAKDRQGASRFEDALGLIEELGMVKPMERLTRGDDVDTGVSKGESLGGSLLVVNVWFLNGVGEHLLEWD
ncbi:hypothetical protein BC936DRAFT_143582 [Jimgerdemannia flammicorona]|uniref:Uncharacterized protein n=1 Tax=Jimgerdemannia flammicorona TaxID=994334 RepID=A0A433DDM0_9FUNG|nr:hypothetical protein BC936DRAFT_143582 [Jimgerdemannia flammicorona]